MIVMAVGLERMREKRVSITRNDESYHFISTRQVLGLNRNFGALPIGGCSITLETTVRSLLDHVADA